MDSNVEKTSETQTNQQSIVVNHDENLNYLRELLEKDPINELKGHSKFGLASKSGNREKDFIYKKDIHSVSKDAELFKKRCEYDQNFDFPTVPATQQWIVWLSYGPGSQYSIDTTDKLDENDNPLIGFRFIGAYGNVDQAKRAYISMATSQNPFLFSMKPHINCITNSNGIIQFPSPSNGDASQHELTEYNSMFMAKMLNKLKQETVNMENSAIDAINCTELMNQRVKQYYQYVSDNLSAIEESKHPETLLNDVLSSFPNYEKQKDPVISQSLDEFKEFDEFEKIHPRFAIAYKNLLKEKYILSLGLSEKSSPILLEYTKHKLEDGRWLIVQIVSGNHDKDDVRRISEEPVFIIDQQSKNYPFQKFGAISQSVTVESKEPIPAPETKQDITPEKITVVETPKFVKLKDSMKNEQICPDIEQEPINTKNEYSGVKRINMKAIQDKLESQNNSSQKSSNISFEPLSKTNNTPNLINFPVMKSFEDMEQVIKEIDKKHPWFFQMADTIRLTMKKY